MTTKDWELLKSNAGPLLWPEIYAAILVGAILGLAIFESIITICGK